MTYLEALILGLVQGVAEFLPISSSGHLIIARDVLNLQVPEGLAVDAVLQLATALAVIVYFRTDLWRLVRSALEWVRGGEVERADRVTIGAITLGTIPAVIAGLMLEETMDTAFRDPTLVAWVLIAGSFMFIAAEQVHKNTEARELSVWRGVVVGLFQSLALIPGVSRSGATISAGLFLGLSREAAARFAFLLSVPIVVGSGLKKLIELSGNGTTSDAWLAIGCAAVVAFASGVASIHYLLRFLRNHTLTMFAVYRIALAFFVLAYLA